MLKNFYHQKLEKLEKIHIIAIVDHNKMLKININYGYWCKVPMEYEAYQSWQQDNTNCWNVEHLIPKREGGTNRKENLTAVHKRCNK